MTKSLAEQLARFGFKAKPAAAIEAPEGFDEETTAPVVEETQAKEVKPTEAVEAEAPKAEVSEAETVKEAPKTEETTPELLTRVAHLVMESESSKAEEAPKTETVAEATPAPEVKVVTAPVEAAPVKKSPKSVSRMRIVDEDVDIDITGIGEVKPISNRGLRKFKENVFGKNSLKEIPREYVIDGVLGKSTGIPCVWEEGGADMASGYALLVADKDGNKKAPVLCLHDKDVSNGKHALIPVAEGDLILLGVMRKLDETEICCTIGTVTCIDTKDERVLITISPAFCVEEPAPVDEDADEDDEATSDDLKIQYTDDSLSFINADHPLLVAGMERVQEKFCHEPKYVQPYVPYKFNKIINDDLNRTFADTKFVQTLQVFNTTNEAYDALEQVIGDKVAAATKRESVLVTTVLNINKDSHNNDCVFIYIVGCVFNSAKEICSSQGGRFFYARVKVLPEETFTYIDARDKFLTYAQAVAQMTLAGKKWVADTVKRVTV